jgi:tRNA (cmo5U34)-methyltransferase
MSKVERPQQGCYTLDMSQRAIEAYNDPQRAKNYQQAKGFDPPRKERMLEVVARSLLELTPQGTRLLELGAGTGDLTYRMLEAGQFHILATDGAEAMQSIAKQDERANQLEFTLLDFSQPGWHTPHAGRFGAVCSSMALHHIPDIAALFRQIFAVLEPNGVLVFSDHMGGSDAAVDKLIGWERARVGLCSTDDHGLVQEFMARDQAAQQAQGNLCESVPAYLRYLNRVGFEGVDCI